LCGTASVLVAKQDLIPDRPLELVFATDGSEFNDRCVSQFLSMKPAGVGMIHVVSAWGLASHLEHLLRHQLHHSEALNKELEVAAESAVKTLATKLAAAGYQVTVSAVQGTPDKVLHDEMTGREADLLVVGAHGKSWVERLMIGSTSLHQVVDEPYNVLVLRP
jgi:nucleotide-binding universal stress UspA family protein